MIEVAKILDELEDLSRSLQVPAAEYVPVLPEAWDRIKLIQAHIMCIDPASLPQTTPTARAQAAAEEREISALEAEVDAAIHALQADGCLDRSGISDLLHGYKKTFSHLGAGAGLTDNCLTELDAVLQDIEGGIDPDPSDVRDLLYGYRRLLVEANHG